MREAGDRRAAPRFPVTLSARVRDAGRSYRAAILDVSAGGLLMAMPDAFAAAPGTELVIDAAILGTVRARVVTTSARGVHVQVDADAEAYSLAVQRVSRIARSW
ncbi:c-di-GMP-binding flagellar brake protein YcgR [Methylobacterium sp. PvP062]|jgi:c-di-GMP-binding flagellar brake protein YcgR|uniref:Type IV pilus assembly PilZ n=2 Tax=Pseudomonadota TaxID=1224 RepID=B1M842_METRJ|nr:MULTISPECIES: PilZ domain-containing protein [Methylobacterium]MBE7243589.1 PilZ domain-containing protein [Actinomycetospora chiangmaiensis]MCX7335136.1 PilZ domain-containing protein [Hyphomicrobiales bacterium]MCY4511984.1 PilZ domain-containing protein [Acidobacteriota bacterium]GAN52144.1 type IV pilus assembly PilZ [Methylobacterium sp. ME121]ACB26763.1 type IV pilus assembly PilZ [Methylobacterium radiotolerans JCM 2831]